MSPTSTWRRSESVSSRVVDGRAVLVIHDRGTLHSLNASGTTLWEALCDQATKFSTLRDVLVGRYALSADAASADVSRFLDDLREVGAVVEGSDT